MIFSLCSCKLRHNKRFLVAWFFYLINNPAASSGVCCLGKVFDSRFNTQDSAARRGVLNLSHTITGFWGGVHLSSVCDSYQSSCLFPMYIAVILKVSMRIVVFMDSNICRNRPKREGSRVPKT
jgi:hypothetical protein